MRKLCVCPNKMQTISVPELGAGVSVCKWHYWEWLKSVGRESEVPPKKFYPPISKKPFDTPEWRSGKMHVDSSFNLVPNEA